MPRAKLGALRVIWPNVPPRDFVGPHFLYSVSSAMIHGIARDAGGVADAIAARLGVNAVAV